MARWATFDCYGTLIDWDRGIGDALAGLWPRADRRRLLAGFHAVEPLIQDAEPTLPYRKVLDRARVAVGAVLGLPAGEENVLAESLPTWPPFPEVPGVLRDLRDRGWRLAILSNTDPDLLAASLERIAVPFELTVTAADAGSYKPSPGHWERFDALSGDRESHVHVGASPFHDLEPCARLGIPAIWINRLGQRSDLPRAAELPTLEGLPEALEVVA
ncbi:MAG TPA: HAD family hydrolase [Actinomycetota bacterium]